jgi:hypothetical protein
MITSGAKPSRLPPGGGTIEKFAAGLAPRVEPSGDTDLEQLDLPATLLTWLKPPLERLGYTVDRAWLGPGQTPRPVYYTLAKNDVIELTLIHLPAIFYTPTNFVALAAASLGFTFGDRPRLHLCAEEREDPPAYLESALKSWSTRGVLARFHPWSVLHRVATEPDPGKVVVEILELEVDPADVVKLNRAQFDVLNTSLLTRFPDPDMLKRMLRIEFGKNLAAISSSKVGLEVNVEDVIERAERDGWIRAFIRVAVEKDPKNEKLKEVAAQLRVSSNGGAPADS